MTRLLVALMALLLAFPAAAHQQKTAISVLAHNPRTEMLEIVHRVPVHDAEYALKTRGLTAPDILNDIESRRAFARYIAQRFQVERESGPIELVLLGTEVEGRTLLIYQEAKSPGVGVELIVNSQILTDVWSRQVNRVNFGTGTSVETLVFREGDRAKSAVLP